MPCIGLKVSILLKAERASSWAGSVSSLGAVARFGDIVLGTFQSCDVEVVGREEIGLGEPLRLLAG